jgi:hypothetical protein
MKKRLTSKTVAYAPGGRTWPPESYARGRDASLVACSILTLSSITYVTAIFGIAS